jgi:hypothetical protein
MTERPHRRITYGFAVRYRPGTDLARRYPGLPRGRFRDAEEAENVRAACPNSEFMEVIDVREVKAS